MGERPVPVSANRWAAKGCTMPLEMQQDMIGQVDPPSREAIAREKEQQEAVVIAVRRLLAKAPGRKALRLYTAA